MRVPAAGAWAWWFGPGDAIRLDTFRRALALCLLLYVLAWARNAAEWLTPAGFHPSAEATRGLQRAVPLLGQTSVWLFLAVWIGAIGAVLAGIRPRQASAIVLLGIVYVSAADRLAAFSLNKLFIVAWAVLLAAPWVRDAAGGLALRSRWPLRVLQATLMLEYFGAGLCKLAHGDYGRHDDVLWYQLQLEFMTETAAWMIRALPDWFFSLSQWAALGFELAAPLLFLVRRLRPLAFAWGLAMHLLIAVTMYEVGYFSFQIVCFYALFVDERTLHAAWGGWRSLGRPAAPAR